MNESVKCFYISLATGAFSINLKHTFSFISPCFQSVYELQSNLMQKVLESFNYEAETNSE